MKETIRFIKDTEAMEKVKSLIAEGYTVKCLHCGACYKETPRYFNERVSCNGAYLDECRRCGCDLFIGLKKRLNDGIFRIEVIPETINGIPTIILNDCNFKYCTCKSGDNVLEVHAGQAEFECGQKWNLEAAEIKEERTENSRAFICSQRDHSDFPRAQDYRIIILKPTAEELAQCKNPYMKYWFFPDK